METRLDARKVAQKKVDYVISLREILNQMGKVNRSAENMEAVRQIEEKLNEVLNPEIQHAAA